MKSKAFNLPKLPDLFVLTYCCSLGKDMSSIIKWNLDTYYYSAASFLPIAFQAMFALEELFD